MHARDVDWAELAMQLIGSTGRERDVAEWQACAQVVKTIDAYKPCDLRMPADWEPSHQQVINRMLAMRDASIEELREVAQGSANTVGRYRVIVSDHEAREAAKLQTLAWTLQTLYRLREHPTAKASTLDQLATLLGDVLVIDWRVRDVPLEGEYRQWAIRSTRRYDLLPKHWRYL